MEQVRTAITGSLQFFQRAVPGNVMSGSILSLGASENAMRIQIAAALIAFLLLRLAYAAQTAAKGLLAFTRLVRANLMHRRPIDRLLDPPPPIAQDQRQLSFAAFQS